jgi:acetyl-CoA carboxylase carboxyl transferase subunit beta
MLGDIILAEPGALVGFAGPRVIEQTIKQELPEGFQTSEFLLEHGMVDRITDRRELKSELASLLRHMLGLPAPVVGNGNGREQGSA